MVEAGMGLSPMSTIPDGQYTSTIYGWIKESKYDDVVSALEVCFDHFLFLLLLRLAFFSSYFCLSLIVRGKGRWDVD